VHEALLIAYRSARFLRRGDSWRARQQIDCALGERLLTMLEWHARSLPGPWRDTWYGGRFLQEWVDPGASAELPATRGSYDAHGLWEALRRSLALFARLARETASRLQYPYPQAAVDRAEMWIQAIYPASE
jgi:hypothetical protein